MTDEQRFWKYVNKGEPDECWEWRGFRRDTGYGANPSMSEPRAHRMSWVLHNGPIPDGIQVLHRCDNPPCCNPGHLFLGTVQDNMRDRDQKKRNNVPSGAQCHKAILDDKKVAHILLLSSQGLGNREIATLYGVRIKVVQRVVNRESWKHVTPELEAA